VGRLQPVIGQPEVADLDVRQHDGASPWPMTRVDDCPLGEAHPWAGLDHRPLGPVRPLRHQLDAGHVDRVGVALGVLVEALPEVEALDPADVVDVDPVALKQIGDLAEHFLAAAARHRGVRLGVLRLVELLVSYGHSNIR
jgi:hypothetical protein